MVSIPIEDLAEWQETFERIRRGISASCGSAASELLRDCKRIAESGLESRRYVEADFLEFAKDVLAKSSSGMDGSQLCLDLSRVHCMVGELLRSSPRLPAIARVALGSPEDVTAANRVFVSDAIHSALSWESEEALKRRGVEGLISFLRGVPYLNLNEGKAVRRSILRRLASLSLQKDRAALQRLHEAFGDDPGIARDLAKFLEP